jgi:hypothetical protein
MMNKKLLTLLLVAGIAVLFAATGLYAATEVGDTITMESKIYKKRSKGPKAKKPVKLVEFSHKKHHEEYKLACGECHHDDKGKALDLKMGDDVQPCDACHNLTKAKKKAFKGIYVGKRKPDDIHVHKNALHENCIGCHITSNKEGGDKTGKKGPAPTSCKTCHVPM